MTENTCSTGSAVQALSRTHSQSSLSSHSHYSYHPYHSHHPNFPNFLRVYPQDFLPTTRYLVRDLIGLFLLSSAVSQSILFTQMQFCSTSGRLINFKCCRVCPLISMQSSRRETRCTSCQRCCEPLRRFSECQTSKELFDPNGCGCVSALNVGDLLGGTSHH